MTIQEFIKKYNGVENVGNTSENKGQCTGLVMKWVEDQRLPHIWGHAFSLLINADLKFYEVIKNTPDAIVEAGDIVVWTKGFNGTYGHTAIAIKGTIDNLEVFEQNNPLGSPCRLHTYKNYPYVDGWLRKRAIITQPIAQTFTDQTIIPKELLGESQDLEIQQIRGYLLDGKRDNLDLFNARREISDLKKKLVDCQSFHVDTPQIPTVTVSTGSNPSSEDQQAPIAPIIQKLIDWLKKWFR